MGYVIRQAHIHAAKDKATAEELPRFEALAEMVAVLDDLEQSLLERAQKAPADSSIAVEGGERGDHPLVRRGTLDRQDIGTRV